MIVDYGLLISEGKQIGVWIIIRKRGFVTQKFRRKTGPWNSFEVRNQTNSETPTPLFSFVRIPDGTVVDTKTHSGISL